MLKRVMTASLTGVDADFVMVEADQQPGLPGVYMVGLADTTIKEARERIRSAINNSGFQFPKRKITINLSPANLPKEGSHFDLPVAVSILGTEDKSIETSGYGIFGELSLDGSVRGVRGALPLVIRLREEGIKKVILPEDNAEEAALLQDVEIYPVRTLSDCIAFLSGSIRINRYIIEEKSADCCECVPDFADVKGQEPAKRALVIAAAGGHGILMMGSPGSGKTMMAKRLPYIMPDMTYDEMIEVVRIHSAAGRLAGGRSPASASPEPAQNGPAVEINNYFRGISRPFRSPHHTITKAALIGGGRIPRPGELSLAHNGILFLDEFGEFDPSTIELLRQPIEDGYITIDRTKGAVRLPSRVMLVAAANPCRCGYYGDERHICSCTAAQLQRYEAKFSGPMLDRIDMHIQIPGVIQINDVFLPMQDPVTSGCDDCADACENTGAVSSCRPLSTAEMKEQVQEAVARQRMRYKGTRIRSNSQLTEQEIEQYCRMTPAAERLMKIAFGRYGLSMRTCYKLLKVARTIADLDRTVTDPDGFIEERHLAEAVQYRELDRFYRNGGGE